MNADNMTFNPIVVKRGRKFNGRGYEIRGGYTYRRGYSGSGVDPYSETQYSKIWDPAAKRIAYANSDFLEEDPDATPERTAADMAEYVAATIDEQIAYCSARSAKLGDALKWARNALLAYHPEMKDEIDARLPDRRDVVAEIEQTLQWASNLKSQPCIIYGRKCSGGKPYSDYKKIRIAFNSLERKGITELEGFAEAFELLVVNSGMKFPPDVKTQLESIGKRQSEASENRNV